MEYNKEVVKTKNKYFQDREKDSDTLEKMISELKIGLDPLQHSMITNIAQFAYKMGVSEGRYVEKYLV